MTLSRTTKDHAEIRKWAEGHGAFPAEVASTERRGEPGILRFEFPHAPNRNDSNLKKISWDDFFKKFDENNLELVYQEKTADGQKSNFNKLVHPSSEEHSSHKAQGGSHGSSQGSGGSSHSGRSSKSEGEGSQPRSASHSSESQPHKSGSTASQSTGSRPLSERVHSAGDLRDPEDVDEVDDFPKRSGSSSGSRPGSKTK